MSKTALLMIDFQNDYYPSYPGAKWPLSNTEAASTKGTQLLKAFREQNLLVVHVRHENLTETAPFFLPNSAGAQIHSSVAALNDEPVIVKRHTNSFLHTNLKEVLDLHKIENIVIAGAMSNMCMCIILLWLPFALAMPMSQVQKNY